MNKTKIIKIASSFETNRKIVVPANIDDVVCFLNAEASSTAESCQYHLIHPVAGT